MVSRLQKELKQTKPFRSVEEEVILNIARTAEFLATAITNTLKAADLTMTQYNVLRILRGAGADGLSCSQINERMLTKESDITRLLDRVEARGFITRERPENNRRMVIARITEEGVRVVSELDEPMHELNLELVGHVDEEKQRILNEVCESIRYKD